MRSLKPLEIGLMFWTGESAECTLAELRSYGLSAGQLGIPGELSLSGQTEPWRQVIHDGDLAIATAVCSYSGESYADIVTVERTVGLVPAATRDERIARTKAVSDFAATLTIPSVACHIGFVPDDHSEMVRVVRDICDHCAGNGQSFALETGQEPVDVLLAFIGEVERRNLKINFDPANLILYGTGDPIEALPLLGPHIVSVHCKDADPGSLSFERRLGDGSVNVPRFIETLRKIGYKGILSIEREEADPVQRAADIQHAIRILNRLT